MLKSAPDILGVELFRSKKEFLELPKVNETAVFMQIDDVINLVGNSKKNVFVVKNRHFFQILMLFTFDIFMAVVCSECNVFI